MSTIFAQQIFVRYAQKEKIFILEIIFKIPPSVGFGKISKIKRTTFFTFLLSKNLKKHTKSHAFSKTRTPPHEGQKNAAFCPSFWGVGFLDLEGFIT